MHEPITNNFCLNCSKIQNTCCTFHDHYIPVTIEEIEIIKKQGYEIYDFLTVVAFDEEQLIDEDSWWKECMAKIDGIYFMICLKSQDEKLNCVMLKDNKGCILGDKRPNICKIYPFWIHQDGKINVSANDYCPMIKEKKTKEEILKIVGESETNIQNYFNKIKDDLIKNKSIHEKMIKELIYRNFYFGLNKFK
jgi:Fe-S-cluster containining protein